MLCLNLSNSVDLSSSYSKLERNFLDTVNIDTVLYFLIFFWVGGGGGHVSAGFCLWILVTPFASCFYVLFMSLFSDLVCLINLI